MDVEYFIGGSEDLNFNERFDVVTAILAHHYLPAESRKQATRNCFNALKEGGLYITFETISPGSEKGLSIGLQRWRSAQLRAGKSLESAEKHLNRYGVELFPVTLEVHLNLLKEAGFSVAEVLWVSGMQAGVYGIK